MEMNYLYTHMWNIQYNRCKKKKKDEKCEKKSHVQIKSIGTKRVKINVKMWKCVNVCVKRVCEVSKSHINHDYWFLWLCCKGKKRRLVMLNRAVVVIK